VEQLKLQFALPPEMIECSLALFECLPPTRNKQFIFGIELKSRGFISQSSARTKICFEMEEEKTLGEIP
jgi:hypothetical protein